MTSDLESDKKAKLLNLKHYKRHIMLCAGPKCCQIEQGEVLWDYLKTRLKDLGLVAMNTASIFRSKAHCLRVCCDGPIAVVYPEDTWYRLLDQNAIDRIIDEHLVQGRIVKEYSLAENFTIGQ